MCMEFWDGWFTSLEELPVIHKTQMAEAVHEVLSLAPRQIYMFQRQDQLAS